MAEIFTKEQLVKFSQASYVRGGNDMVRSIIEMVKAATPEDENQLKFIALMEECKQEEIELP